MLHAALIGLSASGRPTQLDRVTVCTPHIVHGGGPLDSRRAT